MLDGKILLFLCVANSARSQMAEAFARALLGSSVRVASAGSQPTQLNPLAVTVMKEVGLDLQGQRSKSVHEIAADDVGMVITLCAEEVCPVLLGPVRRLHWPFEDPVRASESLAPEAVLECFRATRDAIRARIAGELPMLLEPT